MTSKRYSVEPSYREAFIRRLRVIREAADYTQEEFAAKLGISQGRYKQYETRSLPPLHLVPEICRITGHDPWFVLTGQPEGQAPHRQDSADGQSSSQPAA